MDNYQMETNQKVADYFVKHLVALIFNLKREDFRDVYVVTAFILEIKGQWFFITAAHCIEEIKKFTDYGGIIESTRIIDFFHSNANDDHPIPFPECYSQAILFNEIDEEIDLAIISVPNNVRALLIRNKIQAFSEKAWKEIPENFDALWLFGIPSELINKNDQKISMKPIGLHVYPSNVKPSGFIERKCPRIYGVVDLPDNVSSIRGMSGGPVLAFFDHKYWIFAVQSSWYENSRLIEAIPIKIFCEVISKHLDTVPESTCI